MEKITIRPSSLSNLVSCPWQWYETHILKKQSAKNVRAAIGTSIHAGVEVMWIEVIKAKSRRSANLSAMTDAAVESYDNQIKLCEGNIDYGDDNDDSARNLIVQGVKAYREDILPYTEIPLEVEKRVEILISEHPIVKAVGGTIDYITENTIADIKTGKRKIVPESHTMQQSLYTHLANLNGYEITNNTIHGIVLGKTKITGGIDKLETNIPQVHYIINNLLDRLELLYSGVNPEMLFPGNPKHYLCTDQYCASRPTCKFVKGSI